MQWNNPGRQGYKELSQQYRGSQSVKDDTEFLRQDIINSAEWLEGKATGYLKNVLTQEIERHKEQMTKCEKIEELRYLQGRVDGLKTVLTRLKSMAETAKNFLRRQ